MSRKIYYCLYGGTGEWTIVSTVNTTPPFYPRQNPRPIRTNYWLAYGDWIKVRGKDYDTGMQILRDLKEGGKDGEG